MADEDWKNDLPAWVREDRPLDEAGWTVEFHMIFVLDFLESHASARKVRLFACACCRRVWKLLRADAAKRIVELSEAYADGDATADELEAANNSPDFDDLEAVCNQRSAGRLVKLSASVVDALCSARLLALPSKGVDLSLIVQDTSRNLANDFLRSSRSYHIARSPGRDETATAIQEQFLRDIFGNPFRPVDFSPSWRTDTALALARGMYESRDFSAMPILADALQDAGCDDTDVLDHCRGDGPHVRGCWVVDLVLGKQ